MEIFWKTIGLYNTATWEWQLGIILIGIILTVLLTRNPQTWVKNGMKIYLIAVYLWISVIYYYIYCAERSYNEVMALFWAKDSYISQSKLELNSVSFRARFHRDTIGLGRNPIRLRRDSIGL